MWNASWAIALRTSAADIGHDSATILECAETFPGFQKGQEGGRRASRLEHMFTSMWHHDDDALKIVTKDLRIGTPRRRTHGTCLVAHVAICDHQKQHGKKNWKPIKPAEFHRYSTARLLYDTIYFEVLRIV